MDKDSKKLNAFEVFGKRAKNYHFEYDGQDIAKIYPEHKFRLNIVLETLKQIQPNKILDVGCGSGEPLREFLSNGFDAYGFDYSEEMVAQAKKTLSIAGFGPDRVSRNNMECLTELKQSPFDAIVALGSLYYSRNINKTICDLSNNLPIGGHFIFSLRNELFSLFSQNRYSLEFMMSKLIPTKKLSEGLKERLKIFYGQRFNEGSMPRKFDTVDDLNIFSEYHNPLTVEKEILMPHGMKLVNIYYYHYHALPPFFEHTDTVEFRELSINLEDPKDWRGMFMCSAFVVHAEKI
ncbi:MAG: class I SAM-dependent methyltransferase [Anaerolineaceae bacterium]|nr:class I SAM-dependent methyltransferase [Betaproteobacteria bacterium]